MGRAACEGVVVSLEGQQVQLTGSVRIDGDRRTHPQLAKDLRSAGARVIEGTRNRWTTLLVVGDLQRERVTDPVRGQSQNLQYVARERDRGNHICIVDSAGISNLLRGQSTPCLQPHGGRAENDSPDRRSSSPEAGRLKISAEAAERAIDILRRLIGVDLKTPTGQLNRILGIENDQVIVQTARSPEGAPVPVSAVQWSLDALRRSGQVTIHPDVVGYRSAFIGAVLATLPGVRIGGSPPVARFQRWEDARLEAIDDTSAVTFEGALDLRATSLSRGEQAALRRELFSDAVSGACALCGREYPVQFLRAAHIKRRSVCTEAERRDLSNVAMPACLFGCDALFEAGYISVDPSGRVIVAASHGGTALASHLEALTGQDCSVFRPSNAHYFAWHRANVWRG